MSNTDDHRWDLKQGAAKCDNAFEQKMEEWAARDWADWLARNLTFPFTVTREEDEGDALLRFRRGQVSIPARSQDGSPENR